MTSSCLEGFTALYSDLSRSRGSQVGLSEWQRRGQDKVAEAPRTHVRALAFLNFAL